MGCCCSEVSEYTKQLNKLMQAKTYVTKGSSYGTQINYTLIKYGMEFKEAIILNQAEESIGDEIINGYESTVSDIDTAVDEVNNSISIVTRKLKQYRAEDRAYHRHHHHH